MKQVRSVIEIVVLTACFSFPSISQTLIITGKISDAATGEAIPFANVYVPGKFIGTSSDINGYYKLEVKVKTDSLAASSLGYSTVAKKISPEIFQTINFELLSESIGLKEVVVSAGEPPEVIFFRRIVRAKSRNNPHRYRTFQYESYNKYQIDFDNVTPKDLDKNILLKGFEFLKDYIDTLSEKGKSTLPVFLVEQISDDYEQTEPKRVVER
ncbi:MAG TPA: carboxypeptidase-like regulatory domain-containing protein, partial [Chitinophagales bacterium]|nr:carboxypeptidase-like regulatory domain-containing protein [Chitinophagales bacterium]